MKKNEILNYIYKYEKIIIHGHSRPDGDCYGAQLGLKNIIIENFPNKEVYAVGEKSEYVDFLGQFDEIDDSTYKDALSVVVDTAVSDRISEKRYKLGKEVLKIDHHIDVEEYGDYNFVDTSYPAASEIITDLAVANKLRINIKGATALYTGIVTDTGRFRYRGVSGRTHILVSHLINSGADLEIVNNNLGKENINSMKLKGYVYSNFITTKGGFIYIKMNNQILKEYDVSKETASSMVNLLGGLDGHPVWALMIEHEDQIRVRLRSNGPKISDVAAKFSGGGHARASGATLKSWSELDKFIQEIEKEIIKYKSEVQKWF